MAFFTWLDNVATKKHFRQKIVQKERKRERVCVSVREREAEETSNEEMIESDLAKISDL